MQYIITYGYLNREICCGFLGNLLGFERIVENTIKNLKPFHEYDTIFICFVIEPRTQAIQNPMPEFIIHRRPNFEICKRTKSITINIPVPEILQYVSIYFDFDMPQHIRDYTYDDLSDVDLACIYLEKIILAIETIGREIKNKNEIDYQKCLLKLKRIQRQITPEYIEEIDYKFHKKREEETAKRILRARAARKKRKKKANRHLQYITASKPHNLKFFDNPYVQQYCNIFLYHLNECGFRCNEYDHLCILLDYSFDYTSKGYSNQLHSRFSYAIAVHDIDLSHYYSDTELIDMAFKIVSSGIKDFADIECLDVEMINRVSAEIHAHHFDVEQVYFQSENHRYYATISYWVSETKDTFPVYLKVIQKENTLTNTFKIGESNAVDIAAWLEKIDLKPTMIKIRSNRKHTETDKMPRKMEFKIAAILV